MSDINPSVMRLAHDLYAVYMASCAGLNYQGLPCPLWLDLTPAVRRHWYTVAMRALDVEAPMLNSVGRGTPGAWVLGHLDDVDAAAQTWVKYSTGESMVAEGF